MLRQRAIDDLVEPEHGDVRPNGPQIDFDAWEGLPRREGDCAGHRPARLAQEIGRALHTAPWHGVRRLGGIDLAVGVGVIDGLVHLAGDIAGGLVQGICDDDAALVGDMKIEASADAHDIQGRSLQRVRQRPDDLMDLQLGHRIEAVMFIRNAERLSHGSVLRNSGCVRQWARSGRHRSARRGPCSAGRVH